MPISIHACANAIHTNSLYFAGGYRRDRESERLDYSIWITVHSVQMKVFSIGSFALMCNSIHTDTHATVDHEHFNCTDRFIYFVFSFIIIIFPFQFVRFVCCLFVVRSKIIVNFHFSQIVNRASVFVCVLRNDEKKNEFVDLTIESPFGP